MRQAPQKTVDRKKAAAAKNALQRKKLAIAVVLLAVMAVLWIKLFAGKGKPRAASAVVSADAPVAVSVSPAGEKVVFAELPFIQGRHDILANDFFDAKLFKEFGSQDSGIGSEMDVSKRDMQNAGGPAAAVEAMELVAIVNDKKPQAFIEDKLLEEGQSFKFIFHDQNYEFKVVKIGGNKVELQCNGVIITKKIPESLFKSEQ